MRGYNDTKFSPIEINIGTVQIVQSRFHNDVWTIVQILSYIVKFSADDILR